MVNSKKLISWYNPRMQIPSDKELVENLAKRIVELRKAQNLRQVDIARAMGITQQSYAKYEVGERRVPLAILPTLAQALGTSIEDLLGINAKKNKRGRLSQLEQRFEKVRLLSAKDQQFIIEMIDRIIGEQKKAS